MTNRILILNGPNLNMLGTRQPQIYGHETLADVETICRDQADARGAVVTCVQSNHEGELIDAIHHARTTQDGIIFNAGAYTHTSIALRDAITAAELPMIELHLSNVHAREDFRHHSFLAPVALGIICGFGARGYALAVTALLDHLDA